MIMRSRAELNNAGQIVNHSTASHEEGASPPKYLRDVIKKYYEEDNATGAIAVHQATQVSTDAEKRLQRLGEALVAHVQLYEYSSMSDSEFVDYLCELCQKSA